MRTGLRQSCRSSRQGVVTVTSTLPAACAGAVAVRSVADTNATDADAVAPNFTLAPDTNPAPLIVTFVPPAPGPAVGLTALTVATAS